MTVFSRRSPVLGVLVAASVSVACGAGDTKRRVLPVADASPDAASGGQPSGSGGKQTSGTGGTPAGSGGSGGTGGTGGAASTDAGHDAAADAASSVPDASSLSCDQEAGLQWRDFSTGSCHACPSTLPTCDDFLGGVPSFDLKTRVLVFHLTPGLDELRSASLTTYYDANPADAGSVYLGPSSPVSAVVNGDTLTFDLSKALPPSLIRIESIQLFTTDACGQSGNSAASGRVMQIVQATNDAGVPELRFLFSCFNNT